MDTESASGLTPAARRPRRSRGALLPLVALPLALGASAAVVANRGAEGRVALAATAALIVSVVALRALTRRIVSPLLYSVAFLLVLWFFSPAERLVFVSDRDTPGRLQVFTVDASGGDADRLGATLGQDDTPVTSPDGRRLAFSRRIGGQERLYIAGSRGGGATPVPHGEGDDHHPAWSPDGRWLAFASDRGGDWEIYVMALDGSGLRDLSHHPARDDWPAWSPDGRRLAFESERGGQLGIYLVDVDGTEPVPFGAGRTPEGQPAWSPDGRRLAFVAGEAAAVAETICTATIAGDDRRCLTPPGRYAAPAWSPSGTRLAYAAGGATGWDVFVLPAAGGAARNLSRHAGLNGAPSWASGGPDAALGRWWARLVR